MVKALPLPGSNQKRLLLWSGAGSIQQALFQLVLAIASSYQWAPVSWMEQNRKPARRSGVDACGTVSVRTCCPSSNVDGPGPPLLSLPLHEKKTPTVRPLPVTIFGAKRNETLDGAKANKPADDDDDDGGDGGDSDDGPGEEEEEGEVRDEVGQDESKQLLRHAAGSALAPHPAEEEEEEEDEEEEEARAGESLEVARKEAADEEERDDDEQEEIDDGYSADEDDSARRVLAVPLIPTVAGAGKYQQAGKPQQQLPPPHPKYHRNRRHTLANVR
uniref:Uncharacterized protein n=1 Tax=Anopheles coluzzii TaxID=1518534 RepID=A0A8W7P6K0_ANOCL